MNQREIKFRAWDEENKAMSQWDEIGIGDNAWGQAHMVSELFNALSKQRILMQFTGLKDKNGKDVYEGDVLLIPDEDVVPVTDEGQGPVEPCDHLVPVEFRDGEFGFEIPKTDDGETGWFTWRTWGEYDDPAKLEIIGNIYENPDLLKN